MTGLKTTQMWLVSFSTVALQVKNFSFSSFYYSVLCYLHLCLSQSLLSALCSLQAFGSVRQQVGTAGLWPDANMTTSWYNAEIMINMLWEHNALGMSLPVFGHKFKYWLTLIWKKYINKVHYGAGGVFIDNCVSAYFKDVMISIGWGQTLTWCRHTRIHGHVN